jgi:hypothetical protein
MKEGIHDAPIHVAVTRTMTLTELAIELERKDCLSCALEWHAALERRGVADELAVYHDVSWANAIAGERYGTRWQWEQPTLAREIFLLRRAISNQKFGAFPDIERCQILNNVGNRLRVAGRYLDALAYWDRVLQIQPNFGMALCNRSMILAAYAKTLADANDLALFLWVAHKEASAALAPTALYTHARDAQTIKQVRERKNWIESVVDVRGIAGLDPLSRPDSSATEEERDYRSWSLTQRLFLDPANDLGPYAVAATDSLLLPTHVVPVASPHTLDELFDQMKQEYVSARWMLYEGVSTKTPHFSDRKVRLHATEAKAALSLAIEKVKAAYRISYSLFDKIGFFLNAYMGLGIPERKVSFRRLWRPDEKKPIRQEFDQTGNWGFCALYWLAKDFFEKEHDEVAEPEARSLSDIRNHLEHKYLRVTVGDHQTRSSDDLALTVFRKEFEAKALHLLSLARVALIYLATGVGFEERRREPERANIPIQELPMPSFLEDTEKL